MKFSFVEGDPAEARAQLLVLPLFENETADQGSRPAELDEAFGSLLLRSAREDGFEGKVDQSWVFHTQGRIGAARIALVGLGEKEKFDPEVLRLAAGRAVKVAARAKAKELAFVLPGTSELEDDVKAATEGMLLGAYQFDRYQTVGKEEKSGRGVETVRFVLPRGLPHTRKLDEQVKLAQAIGEGVNWARDLVNEPAGVMNPGELAKQARTLARVGLTVTVKGRREIERLKMGMFLGVAQGSAHEPQLIEVVYTPKNARAAKRAPLALVGKAITFDSGGLSLKSAEGMLDMKTDMAGSAAVLGAMRVIAQLKPPFPVRAYMGACENMPSGTAYRPGDVLISRRGKTVEVTNTDAEGRLVLGDMLTYASEARPQTIIDLATLTGACVVALGHYIVGAWSDDDQAAGALLGAARGAGEEVWRMPLYPLQKDALRSLVADMKNSGERWGGAINAALFLQEFVVDTPWVHLDIAGPSQSPRDRGYHSKGATGVGVRTLVEFVRRRTQQLSENSES